MNFSQSKKSPQGQSKPDARQAKRSCAAGIRTGQRVRNYLVVVRDETDCSEPSQRCLHITHQLVVVGACSPQEASAFALARTPGRGSRDVIAAYEAKDLLQLLGAVLGAPLSPGEVRAPEDVSEVGRESDLASDS